MSPQCYNINVVQYSYAIVFHSGQTASGTSASAFQPESKCAELLAAYCDQLLRKGGVQRHLTADQIDHKLRNIVRNRILSVNRMNVRLARHCPLSTARSY